MKFLNTRRVAACLALAAGFAQVAIAADILIDNEKSQPESLAVAPGGTLYVGSASSPFVYKVAPGGQPVKFVDASGEGAGTFFLGVLVDSAAKTVWTCQLTPNPANTKQRHTSLRGFDYAGKQKLRWDLPGENTTCNDFVLGRDKALYITDTATGRIYRLAKGATSAELFVEDAALKGIDGITFLNGTLYANNVVTNKLYRVPVAAGKASAPVEIMIDQTVQKPDGMRAANGKIYIAENGGGRILAATVNGDKATITVLREGLKTPTGVEPAGNTLWIAERGAGKAVSMPLTK